jgi:hypothetical protein
VNVNQLRKRSLTLRLEMVRLPLTMTEAVLRPRADHATWPPAMAFATFEGTVKAVVGRLTRDDALVESANLQRAELTQRRRAVTFRSDADSIAAEARRDAEDEQARLERRREETDQQRRVANRKLEEDRQTAKRAIDDRTAKKRSANKTAAATRTKAVNKTAARADAERLRKDAQALRAKKRAVAAAGKARNLDKAVRAKKTARRAN